MTHSNCSRHHNENTTSPNQQNQYNGCSIIFPSNRVEVTNKFFAHEVVPIFTAVFRKV